MAGQRALPDLVSRLKLDSSDLQKAEGNAKNLTKSIGGSGTTAASGLKKIEDGAKAAEQRTSSLGSAFVGLRERVGGATSAFVGFSAPLLGVGTGLAGLYGALDGAIVPAAQFEQQLTKLVGTAGESKDQLASVSAGLLKMSGDVGYSASQLADGMYLVESAGFHGSQGLEVLRQSAMAAKAENADMAEVANAVTTALNAYGLSATSASHVTDVLLTATSQGKMSFQDLAGSLDQILPVASAAHVSLNEVAAAIATQTAEGTPAAVAATNLQYAIKGLLVPTSTAATAIEGLGVKSNHFATELTTKGLLPTLTDLNTLLGKKFPQGSAAYDAAISNILGNQEGLNAVLQISGVHAQTFAANLKGMSDAAGKTKDSFDEMMNTTGGKWSRFTSQLQAGGIEIGQRILPAVNVVLDQLTSQAGNVIPQVISGIDAGLGELKKAADALKGPINDASNLLGTWSTMADKGQWKQLGSSIADGILDGIGKLADGGDKVSKALLAAIQGVDWFSVGEQAAPAAYAFVLGFVGQVMNPFLWVQAIQKHPIEGLLTVASLATIIFGPEDLIGVKLAAIVERLPILGPVGAAFVRVLNKLGTPLRAAGEFVGPRFIDGLLSSLSRSEEPLFGGVRGIAQIIRDGFLGTLRDLGTRLYVLADDAITGMGRAVGGALNVPLGALRGLVRTADDILSYLIGRGGEIAGDMVTNFAVRARLVWEDMVVPTVQAGVNKVGTIISTIIQGAEAVWGRIGAEVGPAWSHITSIVTGALDGLRAGLERIWGQLIGDAGSAGASVGSALKGGLNSAISTINAGLSAAHATVPGFPDFQLPRFARGGIIPGYAPGRDSVPALLSPGEAVLRPEAVRMLGSATIDRLNATRFADGGIVSASASGGGSPVVVNQYISGAQNPDLVAMQSTRLLAQVLAS